MKALVLNIDTSYCIFKFQKIETPISQRFDPLPPTVVAHDALTVCVADLQ